MTAGAYHKGGLNSRPRPRAGAPAEEYVVSGVLAARSRPEPPAAGAARAMREYQARATTRYRLRDARGRYVHMADFARLTDDPAQAWIGFRHQLDTVLARYPALRSFGVVPLPPAAAPVTLNIGGAVR